MQPGPRSIYIHAGEEHTNPHANLLSVSQMDAATCCDGRHGELEWEAGATEPRMRTIGTYPIRGDNSELNWNHNDDNEKQNRTGAGMANWMERQHAKRDGSGSGRSSNTVALNHQPIVRGYVKLPIAQLHTQGSAGGDENDIRPIGNYLGCGMQIETLHTHI